MAIKRLPRDRYTTCVSLLTPEAFYGADFSVFRPPFHALKGRSLYAVVYGQAGSTAPLFSFLLPIDFFSFPAARHNKGLFILLCLASLSHSAIYPISCFLKLLQGILPSSRAE